MLVFNADMVRGQLSKGLCVAFKFFGAEWLVRWGEIWTPSHNYTFYHLVRLLYLLRSAIYQRLPSQLRLKMGVGPLSLYGWGTRPGAIGISGCID
jgi:hypothetical protein